MMAKNTGKGRRTGTLRRESAAPDTLPERLDSPYLLGPIGELEMFGGGYCTRCGGACEMRQPWIPRWVACRLARRWGVR